MVPRYVGTGEGQAEIVNRRPTVEIIHVEPVGPLREGDTLTVHLVGTDPDGDPLEYKFRTNPSAEWQEGLWDGRVVLEHLKYGTLRLEIQAVDMRRPWISSDEGFERKASQTIVRTWTVKPRL